MTKRSRIARYDRQPKLIKQYTGLRRELKAKGNYGALRRLPRDSDPNRLKNRDRIGGRPYAYMRKSDVSRISSRSLAHRGQLPSIKKASW